jgi:uncharacterized protein YjbI with pentapeptide repeats
VATRARFRFGDGDQVFDRSIAVFGERQWKKAFLTLAPTDPQPFEKMPLSFERAFGGRDWALNPVGVGKGADAGSDGVARLPNLEDPDDLIDSPGDVPRPACFGPVHPLWGVRWRGLGTYDAGWLRERWPYFPDDFDWAHFQCSPPGQRLEAIRGDEPFVITGMHPEHTHLEGRLPGIQPRCFMAVSGDEAGAPGAEIAFERVSLRLDTVVFDIDDMRIDLVWRGLVEVSAEHAPEVQALFLIQDGPGEETSVDQAYERFLGEVVPKELIEEDPDLATAPANDVAEPDEEDDARAAELAAVDVRINGMMAQRDAALVAAGIALPAADVPAPPPLDPEQLTASLRQGGVSEEDIADVLAALQPPPKAAEDELLPASPRAHAEALLADGASFAGEIFEGGDLSDLDFSGRELVGCDLRGVNLQRASFRGANLTMALLAGADLTDADLTGAVMTRAALPEAVATRARFDEARLDDADFTAVSGQEASFAKARGRSTRLSYGDWTKARFDEAALPGLRLDESTFDGARFDGADLTEAHVFDAHGDGASFRRTTLIDALCDGLDAQRCNFHRAVATGSVWESAILTESVFLEAKLDDASFVKANLDRVDLSAADLVDVRMKRVSAKQARFVKSNMLRAQLERSDLTDADFTAASLYGCEVWESETAGAVFLDALVAMSKLEGRG